MAACRNHPDLPGVGICVRCRSVICAACCTRLQGINYCPACLQALARSSSRPRGRAASWLAALALCALGWLLLFSLLLLAQGRMAPGFATH